MGINGSVRFQHERRPHRVQQLGTRRRRQHGQRQQRHAECLSQRGRHRRVQGADLELRRAIRPQRLGHGRSRNQIAAPRHSMAMPTSSCATTLSTPKLLQQRAAGGTGKVPPYKKNDFGYTVGGPVYIPGVYNKKKEKTFFFWSQEWRRDRVSSQPSTCPCPTVPSGLATSAMFARTSVANNSMADCPIESSYQEWIAPFPKAIRCRLTCAGASLACH